MEGVGRGDAVAYDVDHGDLPEICGALDQQNDAQSKECFDAHGTYGDGAHPLQTPVEIVGDHGIQRGIHKAQGVEGKPVLPHRKHGAQYHQTDSGQSGEQKLADGDGGEDCREFTGILTVQGYLLGSGHEETKVDDQLKIHHHGCCGTQNSIPFGTQNPGFVRGHDQAQKVI